MIAAPTFFAPPQSAQADLSVLMGNAAPYVQSTANPYGGGYEYGSFGSTGNDPLASFLEQNPYEPSHSVSPTPVFAAAPTTPASPPNSSTNLTLAFVFISEVGVADDEDYVDLLCRTQQQVQKAEAFLSSVEKALRDASGLKSPLECWGCTNDPRHHANRFHRFIDCPNKDDPDVRRRANQEIRRLFGDKSKFPRKKPPTVMMLPVLT